MSTSVETRKTAVADPTTGSTRALRNLYYARFVFAAVWAALLVTTATELTPLGIALLVLYPLFDVAAAGIDFRTSGATRPTAPLYVNMALGLAGAVGLAVAVTSGIPDVLRVWGVWAITAGLVQLLVAILRYRLGGQWAMILSGAISTLAGASFIAGSGAPDASLATLGGYATLGGIFFLVSAIRLHLRANGPR